jgi:hypothetical protein
VDPLGRKLVTPPYTPYAFFPMWMLSLNVLMETISIAGFVIGVGYLSYKIIMSFYLWFYSSLPSNVPLNSNYQVDVGRIKRRMIKLGKDINNLLEFRDAAGIYMDGNTKEFQELVEEVALISNYLASDLPLNLYNVKVDLTMKCEEQSQSLRSDLQRIDRENTLCHTELQETLDGLGGKVAELEDRVLGEPDDVLLSLLGPHYPINLPVTQSVKEYIDSKLQRSIKFLCLRTCSETKRQTTKNTSW